MIRLKIGLDWDDTFAPFNSVACKMATKKYKISPALGIEDITSWENTGRASIIKEFYNDRVLYKKQLEAVSEENIAAVRRLMELADVYFISAVYPAFMSIRAEQIKTVFPELPENRIILGGAKDLVQFDMILDDNINNVLNSPAEYPVLMRKPWNQKMTGLLSVNTMQEFVLLVEHIIQVSTNKRLEITEPTIVALVGPSGSGKNLIAEELLGNYNWMRPVSYTSNPNAERVNHRYVPAEYFNAEDYIETTMYAGYSYGTREQEIAKMLNGGFNVIIPLDMCGAIGMKKRFPTLIVYVDTARELLVRNILQSEADEDEKVLRILSLEAEHKNAAIADVVVSNSCGEGAEKIKSLFEAERGD